MSPFLVTMGILTAGALLLAPVLWWMERDVQRSVARLAAEREAFEVAARGRQAPGAVAPTFVRSWAIQRQSDDTVILLLGQTMAQQGSTVEPFTCSSRIHLPPGSVADGVWEGYLGHQTALVEHALKVGLRVPEVTAAAPGAPRKEGAR